MERSFSEKIYKVAAPTLVMGALLLGACTDSKQSNTGYKHVQHNLPTIHAATALPLPSPTELPQPTPTLIIPTQTEQPSPTATLLPTPLVVIPTQEAMSEQQKENKDEIIGNIIRFGGVEFEGSNSGSKRWGPNNNLWDRSNIQIDSEGNLHLQINKNKNGEWTCAEISSVMPLGYGKYHVVIDNTNDTILKLDKNVVFGVFTWDNKSEDKGNTFHREIDFVEFARWGQEKVPFGNAETTVQHGDNDENEQFSIQPGQKELAFTMEWREGYVRVDGPLLSNGERLAFEYSGEKVPDPGDARFIFNLWLHNLNGDELDGLPPQNGKPQEIVIKDFSYNPL